MPNPLTLHPHERAALERGRVLLLRPVEPRPPVPYHIRLIEPHLLDDGGFGFFDEEQDYICPIGRPDATLATDAGLVRVTAVQVVQSTALTTTDALDAGGLHLPNRPTYAVESEAAVARWDLRGRCSEAPKPPIGYGPLTRLEHAWNALYPGHPWGCWLWAVAVEKV